VLTLFFNFNIEFVIREIQEEQEGLGLTGAYQLVVSADGVHVLDADINTVNGSTGVVYIRHYEGGCYGSKCRELSIS
jgi:hypothetical protein